MADRYWVGGTANWDATAGTKWALTSGGAGGQTVPTAADDVYFDANSGTGTVTVAASSVCRNLSFTSGAGGFTGTFAGFQPLAISGNLVLFAGMTRTYIGNITFNSTTSQTVTSNGVVLDSNIGFNGVGGTWVIADNLISGITRSVGLTAGTLELAANVKISAGGGGSDGSSVRSLVFGTDSYIELTGIANSGNFAVWFAPTITNLTITGTPDIRVIGNSTANARTITHGPTGASEARAVSFTVSAGSDTILIGTNSIVKNLIFTSFTGTLSNNLRTIYGDLTLASGITASGFNAQTFAATSGTQTITSNGLTFDFPITINAPGATVLFADNFTLGSTRTLTLTNGILNGNNKNVSIFNFSLGVGTKTLTLGSGIWSVSGSWNAGTNVAGLTVSASTGTIRMTSAIAKTFAGGNLAWPILDQGGAGALTIGGNNTFVAITNTYNIVAATTITFSAGSTQTVTKFGAYGSGGKTLTLNSSTPGTKFNFVATRGTIDVSYCRISDSSASGGAQWRAFNTQGNVNAGGNVGWSFVRRSARTFRRLGIKSL